MYTLRSVLNHDHTLAQSENLTDLIAIQLWNQLKLDFPCAIFDQDDYLIPSYVLRRHMYQLEVVLRGR